MEAEKMLASSRGMDGDVTSSIDGLLHLSNGVKGNEDLGDDLLKGLDSYLEDINDRLMISRMVSDSVIKGMVNAIEQEAAQRIAAKELELVRMKEARNCWCVVSDKNKSMAPQVVLDDDPNSMTQWPFLGFQGALEEHDRITKSLNSLGNTAKQQFKKLNEEIELMKGFDSIKRTSSSSELIGILHEKDSERWIDLDKTLNTLKATLEATYNQVNYVVYLSKASLSEWQQEQEFQGGIEAFVIRNSIRNLQDKFDEKLCDQNARFCGNRIEMSRETFNELSSLCHELDAISKSLSIQEIGHLTTHGYESSEEWNNAKRTDHFHRKVLNNHVLDGNGKQEDSKITLPENLESSQLKHMSKDDLFKYLKAEMTKMKRNHESQLQEVTEEYFSMKREFLKERDPSLSLKKDKEFDILRKKISEVISKFKSILGKSEKLPSLTGSAESIASLKDRLEALLSENRQLRDLVADNKKEVKRLSFLVSNAEEKLLQHSLAEAHMSEMIERLRCAILDAHIEALIGEDVYGCILSEVTGRINCDTEQLDLASAVMQDIYGIIFGEAVHNAKATIECGIDDSEMESTIIQGFSAVLFSEALKDAEKEIEILGARYIRENELLISLEKKVLEAERAQDLEIEEIKKLREEMVAVAATVEENGKFGREVAIELEKEREQSELASREIHSLKKLISELQIVICNSNKESDVRNGKLIEASEKIDLYRVKIEKLNQMLELAMKQSKKTDEERKVLLAIVQEKQNKLALNEATEKDNLEKLESVVVHAHRLLEAVADFECKVAQSVSTNSFRLQNSSSQLNSLIQKAGTLKRNTVLYEEKLKRKCSDYQKAEAEVDLLGDEVDVLLGLMEKIYIALDHYSPILRHYPGIMEILRLIRRELSGEVTKQV